MKQKTITYQSSQIRVVFLGKGTRYLLCFHGYGQDGLFFKELAQELSDTFTLIVMDLPYHGATQWKEKEFTLKDLEKIVAVIVSDIHTSFSVLGYSVGCMMAKAVVTLFSKQVDEIFLLAPVDLNKNLFFQLGVRTMIGRLIFQVVLAAPWLLSSLKAFQRKGWINPQTYRLLEENCSSLQTRKLILPRWEALKYFRLNHKDMECVFAHHKVKMKIIFGVFDSIYSRQDVEALPLHYPTLVALHPVRADHALLSKRSVHKVARAIIQHSTID